VSAVARVGRADLVVAAVAVSVVEASAAAAVPVPLAVALAALQEAGNSAIDVSRTGFMAWCFSI
jgi:hypothetical protein